MVIKYNNNFETLSQDEAVALWQQGEYAWNKWVAENPQYNIDFYGCSFEADGDDNIGFSGFIFPEGVTDFSCAKFNGHADFIRAKFSGYADFIRAKFSGYADFINANFSGDANFSFANFSGDANFSFAKFSGDASFSFAKFSGDALFIGLKEVENIESFSFQYASFGGALDISSNGTFSCLIDLVGTKTSHHVSLHKIKCTLPREAGRVSKLFPKGDWATHKTATDEKKDEARARRLKELAESNKDHHRAKDFHILEMQAKREFNSKFPYGFLLRSEFWFEKLGDYGRSITRPICWLIRIMFLWAGLYASISYYIEGKILVVKPIIYSASQMLAFIPASRGVRAKMEDALFGENMLGWVYLLNSIQGFLAFILLFLLGLALRHKYRI